MITFREKARRVIGPIIVANEGQKRRVIRLALRAAYSRYCTHGVRIGTEYKIWCEECAIAMRDRGRRPLARNKPKHLSDFMPAMRPWVIENGIVEVPAVFDVDSPDVVRQEPLPLEFQMTSAGSAKSEKNPNGGSPCGGGRSR